MTKKEQLRLYIILLSVNNMYHDKLITLTGVGLKYDDAKDTAFSVSPEGQANMKDVMYISTFVLTLCWIGY